MGSEYCLRLRLVEQTREGARVCFFCYSSGPRPAPDALCVRVCLPLPVAKHVSDVRCFPPSGQKDDDIEEGDLPEHKRPSAPVDFSKIDPGKPESILQLTKKGKTLMMFVTVSGSPTEKETEEITSLWQGSLFNANYDVQR